MRKLAALALCSERRISAIPHILFAAEVFPCQQLLQHGNWSCGVGYGARLGFHTGSHRMAEGAAQFGSVRPGFPVHGATQRRRRRAGALLVFVYGAGRLLARFRAARRAEIGLVWGRRPSPSPAGSRLGPGRRTAGGCQRRRAGAARGCPRSICGWRTAARAGAAGGGSGPLTSPGSADDRPLLPVICRFRSFPSSALSGTQPCVVSSALSTAPAAARPWPDLPSTPPPPLRASASAGPTASSHCQRTSFAC